MHQPPAELVARAYVDAEGYAMYAASVADPDAFWGEHGRRLDWIKPFTRVKNTSFAYPDVSIKWFEDGKLNVSANCLDRHLATRGDQTAIIWESDDPAVSEHITYRQLHAEVSKFANVLLASGVKKGDRVVLYLPMIPAAAYAMLACARASAPSTRSSSPASRRRAALAHPGLRREARRHRRRGAARRPQDSAQGQRRQGARRTRRRRKLLVVRRTGGDVPGTPAATSGWTRRWRRRGRLRAGRGGRRGPAVHPLHLRLDRQAEGRAAHHRRLSRLRRDDAPVRLRLPRRRHLLVHRRRRLGDRPQLHRLRAARQRRDRR